ncbi:hypothetical protein NA56DRAFT_703658 [Hyaloscypha hepaticicola]|uniref:Uncharacterized protein n=1 Tax=Hyaloscypha hepaticicola TaxID=2082293 RepID=A0A2J6Q5F0_9HELO|nr:hypothetical protein NA56DRAFT_703658 [Hyaloscypha hepaticicola]
MGFTYILGYSGRHGHSYADAEDDTKASRLTPVKAAINHRIFFRRSNEDDGESIFRRANDDRFWCYYTGDDSFLEAHQVEDRGPRWISILTVTQCVVSPFSTSSVSVLRVLNLSFFSARNLQKGIPITRASDATPATLVSLSRFEREFKSSTVITIIIICVRNESHASFLIHTPLIDHSSSTD